ncbi:ribonuclease H-like domain-containing protein [Tanacetum coccineum]
MSPNFKMPDENQILLKVPRQHNMYSFDMKTPSLTKDYACLIAKATSDESKLWHRRLGHINFKNLNKLVKGNLVRGLPSKTYLCWRLDAKDVSTGLKDVSTGFEDVSTGFTDIKSASEKVSSGGEHVSASQREGKAVLKETPRTKRTKRQIREEQASLAEIARIQAEEEAENARREELKR